MSKVFQKKMRFVGYYLKDGRSDYVQATQVKSKCEQTFVVGVFSRKRGNAAKPKSKRKARVLQQTQHVYDKNARTDLSK